MAKETLVIYKCDKCGKEFNDKGHLKAGVVFDPAGVEKLIPYADNTDQGEFCVVCLVKKLENLCDNQRRKYKTEFGEEAE
jgi:hypothetical protein